MAGCTGDGSSGDGGDGSSGDGLQDGERPLRLMGLRSYGFEEEFETYEEFSGVEAAPSQSSYESVISGVLSGANETHDMVATGPSGMGALYENDAIETVSPDDLDNWDEEKIADMVTNPEERLSYLDGQEASISENLWVDPEAKEQLRLAPTHIGHDSVGTNPKFVEPNTTGDWSMLFDDQFQGESIFMSITFIAIAEALIHAHDKDLIDTDLANLNDPSQDAVDEVIDFLIKEKQAGQFRRLWGAGGTATSMMANEEAVVGDTWFDIVYATRRQGTPLELKTQPENRQGYRAWFVGVNPLKPGATDRNNLDEVHEWINYKHGAWYADFIMKRIAHQTPTYPNKELIRDGSDDSGQGMGPEFYDFAYEGKATYEAVEDEFLFDPQAYEWAMDEGDPHDDGATRDSGDVEYRMDNIGIFQQYPSEGEYISQRWQDFTSA